MIGLVLVAALSGRPAPVTLEDFDLRCVRAGMLGAGKADEPARSALINMATFYIGRLTARGGSEERDWIQVAADRAYFASSDMRTIAAHVIICADKMKAATHSP